MKTFQILSFLFLIFCFSCSTSPIEDFVVGENFINDTKAVVMIDTLTFQSSSVKFDSIITNSSGRFVVGCNYNSFSGYKNSNAFMELSFDDNITNTEIVFDSLNLVLNYDTYYSGDTTVTQTFSIHQLQEEMKLDNDGSLYSTSEFAYKSTPIGSINLKPRPNSHKEVSIRLSDILGSQLTKMIKEKSDTITTQTLFNKFFYGLVIKSQTNVKGAVVGFRTTDSQSNSSSTSSSSTTSSNNKTRPQIRLYYHLKSNPTDISDLYYKFSFYTSGIYFNQLFDDSSNSLLDGISNTNNERDSKLTNNLILAQSGVQIFSKIQIPYIDKLLQMGTNSAFVGATLRIYPVKGTYSSISSLPDSLYVYSADRKNHLIGQVTLPGSTTQYTYALLRVNNEVEKTVYYEIDISSFIDTELKEELETKKRSLMIGYGSASAKKTVGQVILGGLNSGIYSPKLNVYYYHN